MGGGGRGWLCGLDLRGVKFSSDIHEEGVKHYQSPQPSALMLIHVVGVGLQTQCLITAEICIPK